MKIQRQFRWFLSHYGTQMEVEGHTFKGVLLPAFKTTLGHRERGDFIPAGQSPLEEYLYMGDPQRELPVDSLLSCGGRQFVVRSSMTVLFEDAPLYTRAILSPAEVS